MKKLFLLLTAIFLVSCKSTYLDSKRSDVLLDINKENYSQNLEEHEKYITDMLLDYFFINNTNK
jgi:uncharacterized membrane protein SpoIIM required for sporulation